MTAMQKGMAQPNTAQRWSAAVAAQNAESVESMRWVVEVTPIMLEAVGAILSFYGFAVSHSGAVAMEEMCFESVLERLRGRTF